MTAIVGILCQDGVVIGTDSAVSFGAAGRSTVKQISKKINIIGEHISS